MKQLLSIVLLLSVGVVAGVSLDKYLSSTQEGSQGNVLAVGNSVKESALEHARKHLDPDYVCPMHSQILSNEPGSCPICGMDLVRIKKSQGSAGGEDDNKHPVVQVSSTMINNMGVRVAPVVRKTLVRQIETPGFIQRISKDKYTRYTAPAKGRVSRFYFSTDQWLKKGDPLLDIELDDLVLVQEKYLELLAEQSPSSDQLKAGASETTDGEAVEQTSTRSTPVDTAPVEHIPADNADTRQSTDTATAGNDETDSGLTLDKVHRLLLLAGMTEAQIKQLEQTKKTSPLITLYAEHEGEIKELRVAVGDDVKSKEMLFVLGGLMRVIVLANAFQRDASWVRAGQDVDIVLPHDSDKPFKGKVKSGAVTINTTSQNIGVELTFTAPAELVKSGMYVVGNIYGQVKKDALTLPRDAVIYSRNEKRVIVALGDGRFKPVVIHTGISNDNEIEVLSGLDEGDTVVVSAQFFIDSESSLQASYRRIAGVEP
jgi:Cu(I)/Ag(I) efflux system membrane fusion protein